MTRENCHQQSFQGTFTGDKCLLTARPFLAGSNNKQNTVWLRSSGTSVLVIPLAKDYFVHQHVIGLQEEESGIKSTVVEVIERELQRDQPMWIFPLHCESFSLNQTGFGNTQIKELWKNEQTVLIAPKIRNVPNKLSQSELIYYSVLRW